MREFILEEDFVVVFFLSIFLGIKSYKGKEKNIFFLVLLVVFE